MKIKLSPRAFFAFSALCVGSLAATVPVSSAQSSLKRLNACDLLSAEDVSKIIGFTVEAGDRKDAGVTQDAAYSSTCVWKVPIAADEPADPRAPLGKRYAMLNTISWQAGSGEAGNYVQSFRDAGKSNLINMTPVPVQIGDEAVWWGNGVAARKGDVSFGVSVHVGVDKKTEQSMEETLAKKVVPKL